MPEVAEIKYTEIKANTNRIYRSQFIKAKFLFFLFPTSSVSCTLGPGQSTEKTSFPKSLPPLSLALGTKLPSRPSGLSVFLRGPETTMFSALCPQKSRPLIQPGGYNPEEENKSCPSSFYPLSFAKLIPEGDTKQRICLPNVNPEGEVWSGHSSRTQPDSFTPMPPVAETNSRSSPNPLGR